MKKPSCILQIAVRTPLRRVFDYLPHVDNYSWQIGQRVKIMFGRRSMTGVVTGITNSTDIAPEKLKIIADVLDTSPLMNENLLVLYHWASDYYLHPLGEVILGALPKKIRDGSSVLIEESDQ